MPARWKLLGLAGLAGVAATGVVVARRHRSPTVEDPDELRERLHRRLSEVQAARGGAAQAGRPGPPDSPGR